MARAKTNRGGHRDYTRTPVHVEPEETPPPQEMPAVARSRTPTPDEIATSFSAIEAQLGTLREGLVSLWPARNVHDEIAEMRKEFRGYTQSMASAEATAKGAWDAVKDLMPRLDQLLQGHGAVEHLADTVSEINTKLDSFSGRFGAIERTQAEDRIRFDEHDKRDEATAARVEGIRTDVDELKQARAAQDAGDKRELALVGRRRGILKAIAAAIGAAAGWFTK